MFEGLVDEARWFLSARGPFMVVNTLLALVPVALSYLLFRDRVRPRPAWWAGAAAWLLFLPNASYVLTDVVHLMKDIRNVTSDTELLVIYFPAYATFFIVGFSCYVLSIRRLDLFVRERWPSPARWSLLIAVHGAVAVGMYLGRVVRFHSWHALTRTDEVMETLPTLWDDRVLLLIGATFGALVVGSLLWRPVMDVASRRATHIGGVIGGRLVDNALDRAPDRALAEDPTG